MSVHVLNHDCHCAQQSRSTRQRSRRCQPHLTQLPIWGEKNHHILKQHLQRSVYTLYDQAKKTGVIRNHYNFYSGRTRATKNLTSYKLQQLEGWKASQKESVHRYHTTGKTNGQGHQSISTRISLLRFSLQLLRSQIILRVFIMF